MKLKIYLLAAAASLSMIPTAASAVTALTVTYNGTVTGFNSTYGFPFDVPVIFTGVTTDEDAADGSFSYSSFTTNYSGNLTTVNNAMGAFVGSLFRISIGGATFADFNFTGGLPGFATGTNYAVTLSGGAPFSGDFGTAAISGGTGTLRGDLAAAVPEPATWALMLVGFGGMGYAMRRNRKVAVSFG